MLPEIKAKYHFIIRMSQAADDTDATAIKCALKLKKLIYVAKHIVQRHCEQRCLGMQCRYRLRLIEFIGQITRYVKHLARPSAALSLCQNECCARSRYMTLNRGVGRCQILEGHTFSWTRGLLKSFRGHRCQLLKILGGHVPLCPPCSYAPVISKNPLSIIIF